MPASSPGEKPATPARSRAAATTGRSKSSGADPLQTLSQALGTRPTDPRGDVDLDRMTRSYHLQVGTVERVKAAATGVQHRAYDTPMMNDVPNSVSAFVEDALLAACTYWEDLLNGGKEFPRTGRLSPGPTEEGARAGAEKRRIARKAKEAAGT